MGLHSKKDFAEMCGLQTKNLATYIGRGNVIVGSNDLVDDKHPVNKSFLEKRRGKQTEKQLVAEIARMGVEPGESEFSSEDIPDDFHTSRLREIVSGANPTSSTGVPAYDKSVQLLKFLDTEKRKREIVLLQLKEEKLKGAMVPSDLIQPIMIQHNQSILNEIKNATEDFLRIFSKKKALTGEEKAQIRGEFTKRTNEAMEKAVLATVKSIETIIVDYAETRSKGERK